MFDLLLCCKCNCQLAGKTTKLSTTMYVIYLAVNSKNHTISGLLSTPPRVVAHYKKKLFKTVKLLDNSEKII